MYPSLAPPRRDVAPPSTSSTSRRIDVLQTTGLFGADSSKRELPTFRPHISRQDPNADCQGPSATPSFPSTRARALLYLCPVPSHVKYN
ncbi:hypothetical protein PENSPDRAFT_657095 [Peniophora sp. CONT]|nr:hypothetical protein PENSPDRAFT_657095 [Peniophora sp. CONT]